MTSSQLTIFDVLENVDKIGLKGPEEAGSGVFFTVVPSERACVICSVTFTAPPRSRATACSDACRRERRLRYGAAYRQQCREMKAEILAMFGGRQPTEEDFIRLIQQRKGKS
jgi:hypothetical protein